MRIFFLTAISLFVICVFPLLIDIGIQLHNISDKQDFLSGRVLQICKSQELTIEPQQLTIGSQQLTIGSQQSAIGSQESIVESLTESLADAESRFQDLRELSEVVYTDNQKMRNIIEKMKEYIMYLQSIIDGNSENKDDRLTLNF